MVEADLERAEERAESGESYVLRVVYCVLHALFTGILLLNISEIWFLVTIFVCLLLSAFLYKVTCYKYWALIRNI